MGTDVTEGTVVEVDIEDGREYAEDLWAAVRDSITTADAMVMESREAKLDADIAYERATARRAAVQRVRDEMIATDPRTPAQVARLVGLGRSRCCQIRLKIRDAMSRGKAK